MIDAELMSYVQSVVDKRLAAIVKRVEALEVRLQDIQETVLPEFFSHSPAGEPYYGKKEVPVQPKPHPASNTQLKEEQPWRLQSEVMVGGSEKITMDPENHTHLLTETPAYAVKEISDRLGRPELLPSGHETDTPLPPD